MKRYEALANSIADGIRSGQIPIGSRLPSLRQIIAQRGVSQSTVFRAYYLLEEWGLIRAEERTGYFVTPGAAVKQVPLHQDMPLADFMKRCEAYLEGEGCIVDQPFQPRLCDGMIRCYMAAGKVVGFGHQLIKALVTPPADGPPPEPGPRRMHEATAPPFQALRLKMETEWVPQMMKVLDIDPASLPIIWDADFLYGPHTGSDEDTYVLCEINVSSVFPFPEQAPSEIARRALDRMRSSKKTHLTSA